MRVQCRHCFATAKVKASKVETAGLVTLYVTCGACRSEQVWQLSWSHDTTPPEPDYPALAVATLAKLPPAELQRVLDLYRPARPVEAGR